jgi:hypothetical protein
VAVQLSLVVDAEQWKKILEQALTHGGLTVPAQGGLPVLFSTVSVAVTVDGNALPLLLGQVVQIFGAAQIAVLLDDASRKQLSQGGGHATQAREPDATASADEPRSSEASSSKRYGAPASADEDPVWKQVEGASKMELIRLAKFGNEAERRQILKQRDASLHLHVLLNPGITPREVAQVIRANAVQLNFVQRVLERPDLWQNPAVAEALVLNPLTPVPNVARLIDKIPLDTVRRIAKSTDLRQAVVAAAKKRAIAGR